MDIHTHIKNRAKICVGMVVLSYIIYSTYDICIKGVMGVVNLRCIIYFRWQDVPLLLFIPTWIYFFLLFMSAVFSKNITPNNIFHRGMNIALGYGGIVTVLGFVTSLIIPFYLLSSGYVYCYGGGPFSGIYYTKNEGICEQTKIAWDNGGVKEINKLNDKLDFIMSSGKN